MQEDKKVKGSSRNTVRLRFLLNWSPKQNHQHFHGGWDLLFLHTILSPIFLFFIVLKPNNWKINKYTTAMSVYSQFVAFVVVFFLKKPIHRKKVCLHLLLSGFLDYKKNKVLEYSEMFLTDSIVLILVINTIHRKYSFRKVNWFFNNYLSTKIHI